MLLDRCLAKDLFSALTAFPNDGFDHTLRGAVSFFLFLDALKLLSILFLFLSTTTAVVRVLVLVVVALVEALVLENWLTASLAPNLPGTFLAIRAHQSESEIANCRVTRMEISLLTEAWNREAIRLPKAAARARAIGKKAPCVVS